MLLFSRIFLIVVATSSAFASSPLIFVSPVCGHTVSGTISLTAATPNPSVETVQFALGSYVIGTASRPSFSMNWNSAVAMDGDSAIEATALDSNGNQLGSAQCQVQISNRQVTLVVNSPNLSASLSGTVTFSVTGSDAQAYPAVWTLNIDGEQQSIVWTDNAFQNPNRVSFQIDTTRFVNGPHELQISMNSRTGPANPQWVNWRGMVNQVIQLSNGHAWMDSFPTLQSIYLAPGQQVSLGCTRLYTDGTSGACGSLAFSSDTPNVASVSSSGVVEGLENGFAQITVQDGAKSGTSRVLVANNSQIPHFAGNGQFLNSYEPGKSLFVIAPFFLDSNSLEQDSSLLAATRQAGVNTLGFGVYVNPRNITTTYSSWQSQYNSSTVAEMQWAKNNGFHLLLTGDDIFRNIGTDAWYTLNWPSGKQAVQYAVNQLAQTGVAIGIEGIDEASMLWGPRPNPSGTIGAASYLFNQVQCQSGSCTVNWPNNPIPAGYTFGFQGSSNSGLNTASGASFLVQSSTTSGFTFSAASSANGSFSSSNNPNLQFLWFGGNFCTGNQPCTPQVPNNGLATIRNWFPLSGTGVPVAFPPQAIASPNVQGNWIGQGSLSDYASNYFSSTKTRTTYPWTEGIQEMESSMLQQFLQRQPYLMLNRPQLMLVSLAGASYTKGASQSATYLPGVDTLQEPGVSPQHVSAMMMTAAALGGAGIRLYYFEPASDATSRQSDPAGTSLQTGCNPTNLQPASWQAMSYASGLLTGVLAPYLLDKALDSPSFGRNILTAVRQGSSGTLLLIVNGNDWQRTFPVSFAGYSTSSGATLYLLTATGVTTTQIAPGTSSENLTLPAGASAAIVFP